MFALSRVLRAVWSGGLERRGGARLVVGSAVQSTHVDYGVPRGNAEG